MNIIQKIGNYEGIVGEQKKISILRKLSVWIAIVLVVLVLILLKANTVSLIISAVLIIGMLIARVILGKKFLKNNDKIISQYIKDYNVSNSYNADMLSDNFNLASGVKNIHKWILFLDGNHLCAVSRDFLSIKGLTKFDFKYKRFIGTDFGKLVIDLNIIDSYRNENGSCVLTLTHQGVKKIKFNSDGAFDRLIAEKEYYYVTQKK